MNSRIKFHSQRLPQSLTTIAQFNRVFPWYDPGAPEHRQDLIPQDGRNFRIKLSCRF